MSYEQFNVEVNLAEKEPKTDQASEEIDDKDEVDILSCDLLFRWQTKKNHSFMLSYVIFRVSVA